MFLSIRLTQLTMRVALMALLGWSVLLLVPTTGETAAGSEHAFGPLLFSIALLVLVAKAGGVMAERLGQPPVLGELLAGVGLGNLVLIMAGVELFTNAPADQTLAFLSEVGVLIVTLSQLLHPLSSVLVPLFFVLMGMRVNLASLASAPVLGLAAVLAGCAIASKLVCGLGVLRPRVSRLAVGFGMLPRGEVGWPAGGLRPGQASSPAQSLAAVSPWARHRQGERL